MRSCTVVPDDVGDCAAKLSRDQTKSGRMVHQTKGRVAMARALRVVQVGCGGRAQAHLAAMQASGAVDVVAICDLDATKLHETADRFGIAARYTDMAEAIGAHRPELVDIVTPAHIRLGIVEAAVRAGAPAILIEKPMALSATECDALVRLGADRLIAVNTQYRWMTHWQAVWKLLRQEALGTVRAIRVSTGVNLLEQGPHVLDLAMHAAELCGWGNPEWVLAQCVGQEFFGANAVPADTSAVIGYGDNRLWLNAGPSAPPVPGESVIWYQQQVEIIGDRGRIWVSLNQGWTLWRNGRIRQGTTGWPADDGVAQQALFVDLRRVLHAKGDRWRSFATGVAIAAQRQRVMDGCIRSAAENTRVQVL